MEEIDPNQGFSWNYYEDYSGPISDLNYDVEWDDSEEGLFLPIYSTHEFIFFFCQSLIILCSQFCGTIKTIFKDGESSHEEGDENGHGEEEVPWGAHG
jgi:hypothetical protein